MVTDVIEESDHKTLKTNNQTLKTNTTYSIHSTTFQGVIARTWQQWDESFIYIKTSCIYTPLCML